MKFSLKKFFNLTNMKKTLARKKIKFFGISALLMLFFVHNPLTAQSKSGSVFSLGIKAGLANGQFVGQDFFEVSGTRHGLNAGIFANITVVSNMDITIEALYIRSGAAKLHPSYFYSEENKILPDKIVNTDITTNSVNFPLLISFTIPVQNGDIKPRVYLGGDFNLYLSSESLNTIQLIRGNIVNYSQSMENLGTRFKSNDFGAIAGTGFTFTDNSLTYIFDVRYRMGMVNLNTTESDFINSKIASNVISTSFGIAFNF